MSGITLHAVSRSYSPSFQALHGIDLEIAAGEFLAVVGPSGSGKTTLLRLIAGLETPGTGRVVIGGRPAAHRPPWKRGLAMVFQDQAPYPHLSVFENLAFSLRAEGRSATEIRERVQEVAALLGISNLLDRRPGTLSGGERRRVVLGRAVARRPQVLLLDEPLDGLDAPLRASLRRLLIALQRAGGMTVVLVTHDQAEALALGDRVAVLVAGQLLQHGTPDEVYRQPATVEVARFLGEPPMNLLPAEVRRQGESVRLRLFQQELPTPPTFHGLASTTDRELILGVRPEDLGVRAESAPDGPAIPGRVRLVERSGPDQVLTIEVQDHPILLRRRPGSPVAPGDPVQILLDVAAASWFDPATGRRIAVPGPAGS